MHLLRVLNSKIICFMLDINAHSDPVCCLNKSPKGARTKYFNIFVKFPSQIPIQPLPPHPHPPPPQATPLAEHAHYFTYEDTSHIRQCVVNVLSTRTVR